MKTFKVTLEYEVEIANAYNREDVWRREQALLDRKHRQLRATVIKVRIEREDGEISRDESSKGSAH